MTGLNKILHVDLTEKKFEVEETDLFDRYLGGEGVAIRLLSRELPRGEDPFSPESPVIFTVGPLTGVFPCCTKTVCMFKSPLTGDLGESHAGGRFGTALKLAGYEALIVKGVSERPVYIEVSREGVKFKDATPLAGLSPRRVEELLRREGNGLQSILSIGPAGENFVYFANAFVDRYHHFGRLGLGAVLGSKNLKAIVIYGCGSVKIENLDEYRRVYEEVYKEVTKTGKMKKYHDLGTPANVLSLNNLGALPTRNFSLGRFDKAEGISGEEIAERLLVRKVSCPGCPIGCVHVALLKEWFAPEHEVAPLDVPYSYEPVFALGSNLCVGEAEGVLRLILECEELGIDAMTAGVLLSWVTEAYEKGVITEEQVLVKPRWGDVNAYLEILRNVVKRPNDFYMTLSTGVERVAEVYGGREYALTVNNVGYAGYLTGYMSLVGQAVGARHSHLSNAGYSLDQKALKTPMEEGEMVKKLFDEEAWRCAFSSLVACLFARGVYTPKLASKCLLSLGIEKSPDELVKLGLETMAEKYRFKFREGFDFNKVTLPKRFFEAETPHGRLREEKARKMIDMYASMVKRLLG